MKAVSALASLIDVSRRVGARRLFSGLSLHVAEGERLGIIGPNGSGKTTLLKILAGDETPDEGVRSVRKGVRLAFAPQEPEFEPGETARQVVERTLGPEPADLVERAVRVEMGLSRAGLSDFDAPVERLSGGWRKRLSLAAELSREPDLLLLDEPTNHLDLEGIEDLEAVLTGARFAAVFVSHDRYFLENVATAVAEISPAYPGGVFRASGSYSEFLEKREAHLEAESQRQESLANKVRREVEWLRRGPKARTSKSRARIDAAGRLQAELAEAEARRPTGAAQLDFQGSGRRTKELIVADSVSAQRGGRTLFRDLSVTLAPGVRAGVAGPNGAGKSTLLETLLGQRPPDSGRIKRAAGLRVAALDQQRSSLEPGVSLRRTLAPDGDQALYQGRPVHVVGWAKRFLFREEQLETPVGELSGGERARAALAKLMLVAADVLALDEPTNDLDIPTLEALEETLLEFEGALLLVTHDRYLLDRVSTHVIGLDGDGEAGVYADYRQWERARDERRRQAQAARPEQTAPLREAPRTKKLAYHEQREWDAMEETILTAETELEEALAGLEDPAAMTDPAEAVSRHARYEKAQAQVDQLYSRWAELEARQV